MSPDRHDGATSLEALTRALRRRWYVVLLCTLVVPGVALALALTATKKYTATASLLFRDPGLDQKLVGSGVLFPSTDPTREAATNEKLVSLQVVADRTAVVLGHQLTGSQVHSRIEAQAEGKSNVVSVNATDASPDLAARLANTFAEQYIVFRRDADRRKILGAEQLIKRELARSRPTGSTHDSLLAQSRQLELLAALQTGNAEVVQPAAVPSSPSSPRPARDGILGLLLGVALGVGFALLLDRVDRRMRDPDEMEAIFGRPVLAVIPKIRAFRTSRALSTAETEAFRMLRTNLLYFNVDRQIRSVMVTSAQAGDGKSTVAWNLATAAAASGSRTLLIEADMRNPTLGLRQGVKAESGLSQVLAGTHSLETSIVQTNTGAENTSAGRLDLLLAGPIPPNPNQLLDSDRMRELLTECERDYELIVIDTPPTAVVSDAVPLLTVVSGVIVVGRIGASTRHATEHLRTQLDHLGAPALGIVINCASGRRDGYGYGYGYG